MRDITKRFVIVYNNWPFESFDDSKAARQRMQELIDNQTESLRATYPSYGWDVRPLWKVTDVTDVLAAVQRNLTPWQRFWVWCRGLFG
jgi:hypothetical protein